MSPNSNELIEVRAHDSARVVTTLACAFEHDPVLNWVLRKDSRRAMALAQFFAANVRYYQKRGLIFATRDFEGAALWAPASAWDMGTIREILLLPTMADCVSVQRLPVALKALMALKAAHLREPHFYLCVLGVTPEHRGKGYGVALIQKGLEQADRARLPAYLENSNADNLPLYQNHGFEVLDILHIGPGSPPLWRMRREAR